MLVDKQVIMKNHSITKLFVLLTLPLLFMACGQNMNAQSKGLPATDSKALSEIFSKQPDFTADVHLTVGGNVMEKKYARKNGKCRADQFPFNTGDPKVKEEYRFYKVVFIQNPGEPTIMLAPQEKIYMDWPATEKLPPVDIEQSWKEIATALNAQQFKIENLGIAVIDGQQTEKIRLYNGDGKEGIFLYIARGLKDLVVKIERSGKFAYQLSNISLEVPERLFLVPGDYQKVEFENFTARMKPKAFNP